MREFEVPFREGLTKGLRRHSKNPLNTEALVECHNLAPTEFGLEPHEDIILMTAVELVLTTEAGEGILTEGEDRIVF
jgi:hypothetical protein